MPEPRAAVMRMRPYSPPTGGRHDRLRLDFNENTVGCSPRIAEFLRKAVTEGLLATYPDYEEARLRLAGFFGVADAEMLLTNGTDEAIQVLVNTFVEPGDEVIVMNPSYAMYRFYAEVAGAAVVEVPYGKDNREETRGRGWDLSFDVERLLAARTAKTKALLLANPNNPTGTPISLKDIERILETAPDACVLIDEAYFEFHGQTMLPHLKRFDNLFVSRTFSKAYGMAAMRMGCLFSNAGNAAAMRKAQSPYSVNMLAALAASEAIKDLDYTSRYVSQALVGRQVVEAALDRLAVRRWPSEANFVLFDASERSDECLRRCRDAGVLIRDRRHEIPGALRVTAGPPDQMTRFVEVMEGLFT
ncbi:MAG TPA: histidinol-phosphate transaminase [Fimbriimonadaceae bacterium]|nr:histidinol-phosphate transaminase [Fimbriimonadaceae bacterium]